MRKQHSEQIEKEFDNFRKDLRWQMIRNKIARENEVKITEEELLQEAGTYQVPVPAIWTILCNR